MIQEKNNEVLKAIVTLIGETDAFKILDADEIISAVPSSLALDKSGLKEAIKEISDREMIKVKYSNDDEYCLALLPKAKIEEDSLEVVSSNGKEGIVGKIGKNWSLKKSVFFAALFGSLVGGVIVTIISAIVIALIK
ncbi:MAG: hypothetical protein ACI4MT_03555 [Christensenellales bacterium]